MAAANSHRVDWTLIWAQRGFRYFFVAMFISFFGGGLNFAGVSWFIMTATHSTVKVSLQVIVVTLPGLFIPFIGGVLIDRFDRRYLGVALDLARGVTVLATAYVAWHSHLELWHLYLMTLVTGVASAMYWATVNALVQEVIPPSQFTAANAAVLIGVQSGLLIAGAFVGFTYDRAGIAGILAIGGATYSSPRFASTRRAAATSLRAKATPRNIANIPKPPKPSPKLSPPAKIPKSPKPAFLSPCTPTSAKVFTISSNSHWCAPWASPIPFWWPQWSAPT